MAWYLGGHWRTGLICPRLALKFPQQRIDPLMPPYPGDAPMPAMDCGAFYRGLKPDQQLATSEPNLTRLLAAAPESDVEGVGSKAWVLAAARSGTGRPLLASDPHHKLWSPALGYFARLEASGLKIASAALPSRPGLPGGVMGQNAHLAWGLTNTGPDVQDTYLERVKPDDPGQPQTPEGWARVEIRQEIIKVNGGSASTLTVRSSRHGPVMSDAAVAGLGDDSGGAAGSGILGGGAGLAAAPKPVQATPSRCAGPGWTVATIPLPPPRR